MKSKLKAVYTELKNVNKVSNQTEFATKLGYSLKHINEIINEKEAVSANLIAKLQEEFQINPEYFKTNGSSMFLAPTAEKKITDGVRPVSHDQYMEVPYLPAIAQAGYVSSYSDPMVSGINSAISDMDTKLIPREYEKGHYLVVEIVGDSMDDGTDRSIAEGDKILVKELERTAWSYKLNYKRHLFVIATKDGVVCKQVTEHNMDNRTITCHSFNPIYHDYHLNLENDVLQIFYVKKIVEKEIRL